MLRFGGASDFKIIVKENLEKYFDLKNKIVIDIPAGSGYISKYLKESGAKVEPYDLFPELFQEKELICKKADLTDKLPINDNYADIVLFQEGLEHLPNQLFVLKEINRILKDKGILILTTPSISNIRAKISNLLVESELYNRLPANELNAIWYSGSGENYFGHIFLISIQKLRVLAKISGFKIKQILPVRVSGTSLILGILLYPILLFTNLYAYHRSMKRDKDVNPELKMKVFKEIIKLNLNPSILFGKHIFIAFEKENEINSKDFEVFKNIEHIR